MATAKQVKSRLTQILQTVDLDVATERNIMATLEQQLGQPVQEHRQLIKVTCQPRVVPISFAMTPYIFLNLHIKFQFLLFDITAAVQLELHHAG